MLPNEKRYSRIARRKSCWEHFPDHRPLATALGALLYYVDVILNDVVWGISAVYGAFIFLAILSFFLITLLQPIFHRPQETFVPREVGRQGTRLPGGAFNALIFSAGNTIHWLQQWHWDSASQLQS